MSRRAKRSQKQPPPRAQKPGPRPDRSAPSWFSPSDWQPRTRTWVLGLVLLAAGVTAWAVWDYFAGSGSSGRQPPALDLDGLPPAVAAALDEARRQVIEQPGDADAWGALASSLLAHDFPEQSLVCFVESERLDPDNYQWPYFQGVILSSQDQDAALPALRRAVDRAGNRALVYLRYADVLFDTGRFDDCQAAVSQALELEPGHPHGLLTQARLHFHRQDFEAALEWAQRASAAAPRLREPWELLAKVYQRLGRTDDAASALATLAQMPGEAQGLEDPLMQQLMSLRRDTSFLASQAERYFEQNQLQQAATIFQQLIRDEPEHSGWYGRLGRVLLKAGDPAAASQVLQQGLARHDRDPELWFLDGVAAFYQGQYQGALESLDAAIRLKPDFAQAHFNRGLALRESKQLADAVSAFQQAIVHDPAYAEAWYGLAVTSRDHGDRGQAIEAYRRVIQLRPDYEDARRELAELE